MAHGWRYGFKTKPASARRTAWFGNGQDVARVPDSPPTSCYKKAYLFGGTRQRCCPGLAACRHLDEISCHVAKGAHAVLLMDRAGWHTAANLDVPENITPIFLPSRSPELNPVENLWQYLHSNWLSHRVVQTYDAIIDAACEAWHKLLANPEIITSIGMKRWAHVIGQSS